MILYATVRAVLTPLRECGYTISYEEEEDLKGLKYIIRVPKKTKKIDSKVIYNG
jgi:hypothetical protein